MLLARCPGDFLGEGSSAGYMMVEASLKLLLLARRKLAGDALGDDTSRRRDTGEGGASSF